MSAEAPLAPAVILVRPQLAENIGMAARAMLNCGLTDLRLVQPRPKWPHPKAVAASAGADVVIERARLFDTTEEAVADLHVVYATTGRLREVVKPIVTAREAARTIHLAAARGERSGFLFGPERTGLENEEIALSHAILRVPLNPSYASLNIAQAVLVMAYEWYQSMDTVPARLATGAKAEAATMEETNAFLARLEAELDESGFLRNSEMRPTMVRNIRAIFMRAGLMAHEVRTLHGILTALTRRPHAGSKPPKGSAKTAEAGGEAPESGQKPRSAKRLTRKDARV
jgi:tRNA/rRNA methyltransferase